MAAKLPQVLKLEIVTPGCQLFWGEVDEVTVPGTNGYMGILPGHAPLLSELKVGVISCKQNGKTHRFFCGWGFVEVLPDQVSVLAEVAELASEIDVEKATSDRKEAEQQLRSKSPDADFKLALEKWEEAVARLETARG